VRTYTAHVRDNRPPVLVREGFTWGALVFGPIWFALHRAWTAAVIDFVLGVLVMALAHGATRSVLLIALAVLQGMFGNDLRRVALSRRRFVLAHVVAARDRDAALARLLTRRPDLTRVLAQ
jgi:MFS family permease